ncbi:hypothetical protein CsSME_00027901 [Camellia sinensis var. sinensis]
MNSLDSYREAFDVLYLGHLMWEILSLGNYSVSCVPLIHERGNDAPMWGVLKLVSQLCSMGK